MMEPRVFSQENVAFKNRLCVQLQQIGAEKISPWRRFDIASSEDKEDGIATEECDSNIAEKIALLVHASENNENIAEDKEEIPNKRLRVDGNQSEANDSSVASEPGRHSASNNVAVGRALDVALKDLPAAEHVRSAIQNKDITADIIFGVVDCLANVPANLVPDLCEYLCLDKLCDADLNSLCERLSGQDLSSSTCTHICRCCLYSRIIQLKQNPSKLLCNCIMGFGKAFPRQTVDGLIMPCLRNKNCDALQLTIVDKLLKDVICGDVGIYLLEKMCDEKLEWGEQMVALVTVVLNNVNSADVSFLPKFTWKLKHESSRLQCSIGFTKLILVILNKYGRKLKEDDISNVSMAITVNKTLLKKAVESNLAKLNTTVSS